MVPCNICSRHWRLALIASGNAGRFIRNESSKTKYLTRVCSLKRSGVIKFDQNLANDRKHVCV